MINFHDNILIKNEIEKNTYKIIYGDNNNNLFLMTKHENIYINEFDFRMIKHVYYFRETKHI